jgi:hypothetical protein
MRRRLQMTKRTQHGGYLYRIPRWTRAHHRFLSSIRLLHQPHLGEEEEGAVVPIWDQMGCV